MVFSRSPVLLLALTLFLSSAFLSFGFYLKEESFSKLIAIYPETPSRQFEQCQQECWEEQGERRQQQCQQKCQKQYERRSEEEEESPRMKYEQCQREYQEELGERRQQECQQRCQKHYERRPEEEEESPRRKFEQCQRECQEELGYERQQQCQRRCEKQYQRRPEEEEEEPEDPRLRFERCQERCRSKHEGRRVEHQKCQTRCQMEYEERQTGESHHRNPQRQRNNPFYFHSRTFQSKFKSQHGSLRVLPKFTQKSPLLRGIKNYRFSVMEVNPNTFVVPHHCDSEAVLVVVRGQGTITVLNDERRQSFHLKRGNVIALPTGTTFHLVNSEKDERLMIASLKKPFNAPGTSEEFFLAGGKNPQSYFSVFSDEVLEFVLNTPRDQIRKLFKEQREEGLFRRASEEQLRALRKESSSSPRQIETQSESLSPTPIDLLNQSPVYSNENGRYFEANPEEFKQLRGMDFAVGITEMKQGSILVPHYATEQTTIVFIAEGNGRLEMVSPQSSKQREREEEEGEEQRSGQLRKITTRVNPGDIFVIPAGFPVTLIASPNVNLSSIFFGINAKNNEVIWLAGRNNIVKNMEREAQELSFGVPARQVQQVFGNQEESYIVSASRTQQMEEE